MHCKHPTRAWESVSRIVAASLLAPPPTHSPAFCCLDLAFPAGLSRSLPSSSQYKLCSGLHLPKPIFSPTTQGVSFALQKILLKRAVRIHCLHLFSFHFPLMLSWNHISKAPSAPLQWHCFCPVTSTLASRLPNSVGLYRCLSYSRQHIGPPSPPLEHLLLAAETPFLVLLLHTVALLRSLHWLLLISLTHKC